MTISLFYLSDKVALAKGASRGIGEEVARLLAEQGAHVIVSSRKQDACEIVAESIRENGGKASTFTFHIGELEQQDYNA
jgi:NAD(P)-dependent dehydrogenase (short-subunit alcohol dehydrogenase family)